MRKRDAVVAITSALVLAFGTGAAAADEYDDALRCMLLIEFAKIDYEAGNIDTLRDAGNLYIEETNRTRPPDLSDQQKLDRYYAVLGAIQAEGGLGAAANRETARACTARFDLVLNLP